MELSKNVVRDLLPVYLAGEASAETRAVVERALAGDAELREESRLLGEVPALPEPAVAPGLGVAALKRTQSLLRRRTFLVGFCYFFNTLVFAFVDRPAPWCKLVAGAALAVSLGGWMVFLKNAMGLRDTGLAPRRSIWPQLSWQLGSWCIVLASGWVVYDWTHWQFLDRHAAMGLVVAMPLAYLGQRLKQYRPGNEVTMPVETLMTLSARAEDEE